jgi:hypothetical protein
MVMTVGHAKAERIDKFEFPVLIRAGDARHAADDFGQQT